MFRIVILVLKQVDFLQWTKINHNGNTKYFDNNYVKNICYSDVDICLPLPW